MIPRVVWIGPDGDLSDVENITMGHLQTSGTETTRSLTLRFLQSHYGGWYSCIAAVNIPGLETPPQKPAHKHLAVISTLLLSLVPRLSVGGEKETGHEANYY